MTQSSDLLLAEWMDAARDLGLEIEPAFILTLDSGVNVRSRLLLRHFGYERGMIVITDFNEIAPVVDEVIAAGYGFSTLSEPRAGQSYERDKFTAMLRDWTWAGPEALRPPWCTPLGDEF